MIFANRTRRGRDRYLWPKAAALVIGALFVLWGSRTGQSWPVWAGIAALAAAFAMRFLPGGSRRSEDETEDQVEENR
jgi:membrane protein implicated in regulation of membrane protease activity